MDGSTEQPGKKRRLDEPYVRDPQYILRKHRGKKPSLIIHLHPTHFKFEGQDGSFAYDSEMKFVLEHLKRKTVPHQMMQELLDGNVTFYDGCLIIEVHNHRARDKGRHDSAADDDTVKFSMHNYNSWVTPSPLVAFPSNARIDETPEKSESAGGEMAAPERPKEKDGPRITTIVLFPTPLSHHHEMLILANTPASDVRNKKRGSDSATPSSAQPPTPQLSVPPTPIGQSSRAAATQSQKMCLEEGDLYTFQADLLVATEPPLYLEPVDNPQDAQKVLDMLQHPLHQDEPPSPKTRKRTTAEVAADDAQKQETVRRMLIMDERIKAAGAGATSNENQGAATSLTFSRFKTIDMVRQRLEEAERVKKEEEFRVSAEKKQAEEQNALQQQQQRQQQRQQQILLAQQQSNQQNLMMAQQQQQQNPMRARAMAQAQQQAQMNTQNHAHPQQNAMMQNQQQNFQHGNQVSMAQSSPVVRQQTPMMNSSPMMAQGGFPMTQTSSQGASAASPPRPTSAMQHPMARQVSQQQQGSRNATPQIPQATPNMGQAMPNRQMSQTPRLPPGSPAAGMQHGTPTSSAMPMQTPHMGNQPQLTPEQMALLHQQRAMSQGQQNAGQAGSPQNMTPEQIQNVQNIQRQREMQRMQQQAAAGNPQAQQMLRQKQAMVMQQRQQQQQQMLQAQQNAQMQGTPGPAGSPSAMPQQTPQIGHAHPQQQHHGQQGNMPDPSQMTPQQQHAMAQARANQLAQARASSQQQHHQMQQQAKAQLNPLIQQYGSIGNIPSHILQGLPAQVQQMLRQQHQNNQLRQAQAMRAQQAQQQQAQQQNSQGGGGGGEQVPAAQPNPQYMQQLRNNQAMLAQAQQQMANQQQQGGGMNGMTGMSFHMNGIGQNFGGQQGGGDLSQQFAAMQNALNRSQQGGGGQGMQ